MKPITKKPDPEKRPIDWVIYELALNREAYMKNHPEERRLYPHLVELPRRK